MKALCKTKPCAGADYAETAMPSINKDEILIKIHSASICGSDLPIYNWTGWAPKRIKIPMVFGHELCGHVIETGTRSRGFAKGDFVSVESHIFCGLCYQCRNDQRHVCANTRILGIDSPGGFAEYAAVPPRCAWKHSDGGLKDIGSIMEPFGNAVYAVLTEDVVSKTVLVLGCGPQGLFAAGIARACGAKTVIAVESSAYRRKLALKMGADAAIDSAEPDVLSRIKKAAKSHDGVDVVLEMSGHPDAINLGFAAIRNAGRFTAFGLPGKKIEFDYANQLVFKGVRVYGIVGREIFKSWYKMESLLKSKAVDPRPVITHTFKLKDHKKAFEVMSSKEKKCGKVVLVP